MIPHLFSVFVFRVPVAAADAGVRRDGNAATRVVGVAEAFAARGVEPGAPCLLGGRCCGC